MKTQLILTPFGIPHPPPDHDIANAVCETENYLGYGLIYCWITCSYSTEEGFNAPFGHTVLRYAELPSPGQPLTGEHGYAFDLLTLPITNAENGITG